MTVYSDPWLIAGTRQLLLLDFALLTSSVVVISDCGDTH